MAPLGIPMYEGDTYEPKKRQKAAAEKQPEDALKAEPEAKAGAGQKPAEAVPPVNGNSPMQASEPVPPVNGDAGPKPAEAPQPPQAPENQAAPARSATDEYRQQMRNAALLQAKQAEILQRQSEQLDYSQKLLERYEAILARHEQKLDAS